MLSTADVSATQPLHANCAFLESLHARRVGDELEMEDDTCRESLAFSKVNATSPQHIVVKLCTDFGSLPLSSMLSQALSRSAQPASC